MHGVELFHKFSSRILQNVSLCPDKQTVWIEIRMRRLYSLMLELTLSVNLWGIYFVKNITLKWQYSGFNNMFNFFSAGYGLNLIIKAQDAIVNFSTPDKTTFFALLHIRICFRPY